jgi:hypothetical protein
MRRSNYLQQTFATFLASLTTLGGINVSLEGFDYMPYTGVITQIDQVLAANPAIQRVEIISARLMEGFLTKLPRLNSKNIIYLSHDYIDASYYTTK